MDKSQSSSPVRMRTQKVDFFIAGVQKAGTTALFNILSRHPDLSLSARKELHFFDSDKTDWSAPNYDILHQQFEWARPALRGEATPIYCYWPDALKRLRDYNGLAKIIVLLRHPSFRAHSHWRMETARGAETLPFEAAIGAAGRARVAAAPGAVHRIYSYVERGFYAAQVKRAQMLFPPAQLMFLRTEDLWSTPDTVIAQVDRFLGTDGAHLPSSGYVVPVDSRHLGAMSPGARATLDALFRDDIIETANLTGLDLSTWLSPAYVEPLPMVRQT